MLLHSNLRCLKSLFTLNSYINAIRVKTGYIFEFQKIVFIRYLHQIPEQI